MRDKAKFAPADSGWQIVGVLSALAKLAVPKVSSKAET